MPKKPKFKPEITQVKLNPEQAVLECACYDEGHGIGGDGLRVNRPAGWHFVCNGWPNFNPKGKCYNITYALYYVSS